jgi:hypothetical protein
MAIGRGKGRDSASERRCDVVLEVGGIGGQQGDQLGVLMINEDMSLAY